MGNYKIRKELINKTSYYPHTSTHNMSTDSPHKQKECGKVNLSPQKIREVYMDYKQLQDPFLDLDENKNSIILIQIIIYNEAYNAATNNAPLNLKQVRNSNDWAE